MPDYISMTYRPGNLPDYTPRMGGGHPERFHDERSLMTFLRKCVEQGILRPVDAVEVPLIGRCGCCDAYHRLDLPLPDTKAWQERSANSEGTSSKLAGDET